VVATVVLLVRILSAIELFERRFVEAVSMQIGLKEWAKVGSSPHEVDHISQFFWVAIRKGEGG
jgi:hypothetical protein